MPTKRYAPGGKATKFLRLTSSIIIVLSLALPVRSCVTNGHTEINFPLSDANSVWSVVEILALYLIPLLVLFATPQFRTFATFVGHYVGCA
jgi:membrane protein YdbS with pleckstrin-like domain